MQNGSFLSKQEMPEGSVMCGRPNVDTEPCNYNCVVELDVAFLPPNASYFQIIHIHRPLEPHPSGAGTIVTGHEFIGAICPGNPYGNENFDFRGCSIDNR